MVAILEVQDAGLLISCPPSCFSSCTTSCSALGVKTRRGASLLPPSQGQVWAGTLSAVGVVQAVDSDVVL